MHFQVYLFYMMSGQRFALAKTHHSQEELQ